MIMLRCIVTCFLVIFGGAHVYGGFPSGFDIYERDGGVVEDVIDIHAVDGDVVAVRKGRVLSRQGLGVREEVLWIGSKGHVGAVLTNRRLLVISASSANWQNMDFRLDEAAEDLESHIMISNFLVLAVTHRRIIFFDGLSNAWAVKNIPLHDRIEKILIDHYVAAVITEKRAYGVAARRGRFVEQRFGSDEKVESTRTRPHSVTIYTNRNLFVFRSRTPFWSRIGDLP